MREKFNKIEIKEKQEIQQVRNLIKEIKVEK
jgi:hypothetical protein